MVEAFCRPEARSTDAPHHRPLSGRPVMTTGAASGIGRSSLSCCRARGPKLLARPSVSSRFLGFPAIGCVFDWVRTWGDPPDRCRVDPHAPWRTQVRHGIEAWIRSAQEDPSITLSWIRVVPALGEDAW